MKSYLLKESNGIYYYRRRVPTHVIDIADKKVIKVSLKTRDMNTAKAKAAQVNIQLESFWDDLLINGSSDQDIKYKKAVKIANLHGFQYMPIAALAQESAEEIIQRLNALNANSIETDPNKVSALLGGVSEPDIFLSNCFDKFLEFSQGDIARKSDTQKKRWCQEKQQTLNEFISICGDKELHDLKRSDIMLYRTFLLKRLENKEIRSHTVNRKLEKLKAVFIKVQKTLQLPIDIRSMFLDLRIKDDVRQRKSFSPEEIKNIILNKDLFKNLNTEAYDALLMILNTGLRPSELCGLDKDDIMLDHEIPYIKIREKDDEERKSKQSTRDIPLVGLSLKTFKRYPKGFKKYYRKSNNLSACLCKYFKDNNIQLAELQTPAYSLRHSFQDFLRQNKVDRRIQCALMGHKFEGMLYGEPTLQEKRDAIQTFAYDL